MKKHHPAPMAAVVLIITLTGCASGGHGLAAKTTDSAADVARVLDDFHDAAAQADEARYFAHFAPEAVFLGTDGGERWDLAAFRSFAHPYFAAGKGWTYRAMDRRVYLEPEGRVAWFDEKLDNESYGPCRGSGVLTRTGQDWKIAQYNLSIPIPNDLAKPVVAMIRERSRGK